MPLSDIFSHIRHFCTEVWDIWRKEYKAVFHDTEVLVFFFLLTVAYPILYAMVYNPEVIRNVPVAIVDDDHSALSRDLVRNFNATPQAEVISYCANMDEARHLMMETKCYGILHIPAGFYRNILRGESGVISFYADMSLLLNYKTLLLALSDVTMEMGAELRMASLPLGVSQSMTDIANALVPYTAITMYNPDSGFASFLIPAVLALVLQQSLILGLGTLVGGINENDKKNLYYRHSPFAQLIGRSLCYYSLYILNIIYLFNFIPWVFGYPQLGNASSIFLFATPYLFASIFFGMTLSVFIQEREQSFLLFVFTSVIFLFISGIAWPRYAMPAVWQWLGVIIPSTWGIEGFVQMNTTGASLSTVVLPYLMLWILTILYASTATLILQYKTRTAYKITRI